ncbi:MAG: PcfJ domain-containing protein [Planctomycetota bacterium]
MDVQKNRRAARWVRKQKRSEREKRVGEVLRERKKQRKLSRGAEQIMRHAPSKRSSKKYTLAVGQLWDAAQRMKCVKSEHLTRPGYIGRDNPYLFAMACMADRHEMWVRDPAKFRTSTHNTERQFTQFVQHLFANYPVPTFFEHAWFEQDRQRARQQQRWYIQLGQGQSPRRLGGLPIEMSRRAAHLLPNVPERMTIDEGLRWTQVRAMGADPMLTDALLASPIGTDFARDDFWLTVVRFLIDQPMLDTHQVGPIVDYIHNQRHEPQYGGDLDGDPRPPQPNFSMKGRSIDRLLRQVTQWHGRLAASVGAASYTRWEPSGIPGKQWAEGVGNSRQHLVIRELLDSVALCSEGARMNHCVGSYVPSCKNGASAIFTLNSTKLGSAKALLTIEVRPATRTIVQARGKCNRTATPDEMRMVRNWAAQSGLQLSSWL